MTNKELTDKLDGLEVNRVTHVSLASFDKQEMWSVLHSLSKYGKEYVVHYGAGQTFIKRIK